MNTTRIPRHIAIIPDGNRRWAKEKGLPTLAGHKRGFDTIFKIGKHARKLGIKIFTVWAFSTENWNRDKKEVDYLMKIYEAMTDRYLSEALRDEIRIIHIGRKDRIPKILLKKINNAEERTKNFEKYYFVVALDYGGRDELLRAINKITSNKRQVTNLTDENFNRFLDTADLPYPNPDLLIRTSGEQRISGFMSWQTAYTEFIFVKKHLPDFTVDDFENCIVEYDNRQRRFGR